MIKNERYFFFQLLTQLGVERLILPAIPQLRKMWETSFGFSEMPFSERLQLSGYPFLCFQGTMMLQKFLNGSMTETNGKELLMTEVKFFFNQC